VEPAALPLGFQLLRNAVLLAGVALLPPEHLLRTVKVLTDQNRPGSAAVLLEGALRDCPEHPGLLAGLTGLRVLQGHLGEAEALATRYGWLRADWGIDPHDGASTPSAAWAREHRLHRVSAH
jgi:hypothetical protein